MRSTSGRAVCFFIAFLAGVTTIGGCSPQTRMGGDTVKVGVLHSLSGTMALSEKAVADATLMAIEEINKTGGVLGRQVEPVTVDGRSDASVFAREAERLIAHEHVKVVFGCWTSACRKTVKPIFEQYDHLLFYPVQYEGLEQSPNIVYTGAAPNQQIIPAITWALAHLGKRVFLVGSDYVFPRSANAIINAQVTALGGTVIGEEYVLLGSQDVKAVVQKIVKARPDMIFNTINGDTNVGFFNGLRAAGVAARMIPSLSFSIAESEQRSLANATSLEGDYAAWNYFQSIDTKENRDFVRRFKERYGKDRVTDDPMEAGYFGVYLWAQAVESAGTAEPNAVRRTIGDQSLIAPEGIVSVDAETQHTWKTVRIGKFRKDGQFDIVWTSDAPIRPVPYPIYRSKSDWEKFLLDLYNRWGRQWANPGRRT